MRNPRANLPDAAGYYTEQRSIPRQHGLAAWIARSLIMIAVASLAYTALP